MPKKRQVEFITHPDQLVEQGMYAFKVLCPEYKWHHWKGKFVAMKLFYNSIDPPPRRPQLHIVIKRKVRGEIIGQAIPWKQIKECVGLTNA